MRLRAAALVALVLALPGCSRHAPAVAAFDPDSIPEAYQGSTAALMWPGATRAFQIRPDGDLYNGAWRVTFDLHADGRDAAPPRAIAYEERWRPVAHWARHSGRVRWNFEAAALPAPDHGDSSLVVSLVLEAVNTGSEPLQATIAARLAPPDTLPPFVAVDDPRPTGELHWGLRGEHGIVHAMADPADVGSFEGLAWTLPPGAAKRVRFVLPAHATGMEPLAAWARTSHARRVDEARVYWNDAVARGTRFDLGDAEVERALDAARVVLLASRERRGLAWVPIGAPLHYRDVWLRDGARVIAALAVAGHSREARDLAGGLRLFAWPDGAFMSQRGQLDGTGEALWAFEQALLRPAAATFELQGYADLAMRAFRWYEWQRDLGHQAGWTWSAMMPFADPRDNELVRAQLIGSDAWAIAGYRSAARLLRAAGRVAEADTIEAARTRYLAEFADALNRSHAPDIPASWQGIGRDWGNLTVGWPAMALPPSDTRCAALAARVWRRAGGAGLATYADSLHYYAGADLGEWALLAGRRAEADSVMDAMLRWRSASGGAAEIFSRDGGYGRNLPPHATSAAALVLLVRNALIFDDADRLLLTLGARDRWWRGARVRGAPTRWGTIDLAFRRDGDAAEWTWTGVPVRTALTLPAGTRWRDPLPAPLAPGPTPTIVIAPPGTTHARVPLVAAGAAER
ncbi:MAG: hypothetical protein HY076_03260 [Candidatus Eisenbacteria bacterium]|uniref:Uncharacterized protein n=1 Tax=Eiseniibacteriota bacterium TaxID=2212470 RepID=A0A9D6QM17_UNCEI|nr:hypothetical protein [Candidatus Eisenbacteria bacterium]MBI3539273.1 hypothetical protein [Candidatus Eisenbacteria bacterium]